MTRGRVTLSMGNESRREDEMASTHCHVCGSEIDASRLARGAKYCSLECRRAAYAEKYRTANDPVGAEPESFLAPNQRAALSELLVAADLIRRGYHVFRALSSGPPCNLMVLVGERVYRIYVKAGLRTPTGRLMFPNVDRAKFDVLAVVERNGAIHYVPALDEFTT